MIFTDKDGKEYELVGEYANPGIVIKPVKKTEKKGYKLDFSEDSTKSNFDGVIEYLNLAEDTAHKLSEAISALVEYMQTPYEIGAEIKNKKELLNKADEARESYQESQ